MGDLSIYNTLCTILMALFGGCNILQLANNRALRKKLDAEADATRYNAQDVIIDGLKSEVERLQKRVEDGDIRYGQLEERYSGVLNTIVELRAEIAQLKTQLNNQ